MSNILLDDLLIQGFEIIYDQFYWHELSNIKLECTKDSVLCVGGEIVTIEIASSFMWSMFECFKNNSN